MDFTPLPFDAALDRYEEQAIGLLDAFRAGDSQAVCFVHSRLPRFLRQDIPWVKLDLSEDEVRAAPLDIDDARLAVARGYDFLDWSKLEEYALAVSDPTSAVFQFESAVEAVISGDLVRLQSLLAEFPELARARSTRVTHFDPPEHRATLLHYVAANGVEGYRQKSPQNTVEIARAILDGGAEADALANMYGGECNTMSMLVSSCHPANAGVQVRLVHLLLDYGADVDGVGKGEWVSNLMTALAFGYLDAAQALVDRGAKLDNIAAAAGLGRLDDAARLLPTADELSRHRALALAAQHGHVEIVQLFLDAGEDPNRYNPKGNHGHSTPMHQAAWAGHLGVVRLLVERGARTDIKDTVWQGTALGWAEYGGKKEIADYLRGQTTASS